MLLCFLLYTFLLIYSSGQVHGNVKKCSEMVGNQIRIFRVECYCLRNGPVKTRPCPPLVYTQSL